mmetsp:Transcript_2276/g.2575  ORF Transcript_2276/g.2575 Transcript_2276/m.2575 type:complete len:215 (+) Transcript_2276:120-764(+)
MILATKLYFMMKFVIGALFPSMLFTLFRTTRSTGTTSTDDIGNPTCPGSPSWQHAKCSMITIFPKGTTCNLVQTEITSRILGVNGWTDPHNHGTYTLLNQVENQEENMTQITGSRLTGDGKYTDIFIFTLEDSPTNENGCILRGCSESQVFSVLDFSTNYCNLRSLYCNNDVDGCPIVKENFTYEETYVACRQNDASQCFTSDLTIGDSDEEIR